MTTLLIGHRGVGKSSLLNRIQLLNPDIKTFDLDKEIEKATGQSIDQIFIQSGEVHFRTLEKDTLNQLIKSHPGAIISLGAGFSAELPKETRIIWVRRATDKDGRIFLDRPRLNPDLPPLEEFFARAQAREVFYRTWATEELILHEGAKRGSASEYLLFSDRKAELGGYLTLRPENFRLWDEFITRRKRWGFQAFEIRDDLLSPEQIGKALKDIEQKQILYSVRTTAKPNVDLESLQWDLDVNINAKWTGELPPPSIFSLHERKPHQSLESCIQKLESRNQNGSHLKLAVSIYSFDELLEGFRWQQEKPKERSFLPMSQNGHWTWVRLRMKAEQKLNFIRETEGTAPDQPTLNQWMSVPHNAKTFAAILGSPVAHSWTPAFHRDFFTSKNMFVGRIDVKDDELDEQILKHLGEIGLRAAAVTAPLKDIAFGLSNPQDKESQELKAINTLVFKDGKWLSWNTDFVALKSVLSEAPKELAMWGGGGTKAAVRKVRPDTQFYLARSGQPEGEEVKGSPRGLIWALGRSRAFQWPPESWKPDTIYDLNYQENSPGLELALRTKSNYVSGESMFELQALEQQKIWNNYL